MEISLDLHETIRLQTGLDLESLVRCESTLHWAGRRLAGARLVEEEAGRALSVQLQSAITHVELLLSASEDEIAELIRQLIEAATYNHEPI